MEGHATFLWVLNKRHLFVSTDVSVIILDVHKNIPYLTSKSIHARVGDEIILKKTGVHFTSKGGRHWASIPIGVHGSAPAVPATDEEEVPQVGADVEGAVHQFDPSEVDETQWRLLATKQVKHASE